MGHTPCHISSLIHSPQLVSLSGICHPSGAVDAASALNPILNPTTLWNCFARTLFSHCSVSLSLLVTTLNLHGAGSFEKVWQSGQSVFSPALYYTLLMEFKSWVIWTQWYMEFSEYHCSDSSKANSRTRIWEQVVDLWDIPVSMSKGVRERKRKGRSTDQGYDKLVMWRNRGSIWLGAVWDIGWNTPQSCPLSI